MQQVATPCAAAHLRVEKEAKVSKQLHFVRNSYLIGNEPSLELRTQLKRWDEPGPAGTSWDQLNLLGPLLRAFLFLF